MTITKTGEAYFGEFESGKESGYGYCYRYFERFEVQKLEIWSLNKIIPLYTPLAIYEGELFFFKHPILDQFGQIITPKGQIR